MICISNSFRNLKTSNYIKMKFESRTSLSTEIIRIIKEHGFAQEAP